MKNHNTIQFTTLLIVLSILTFTGEFALIHILKKSSIAILISCIILLLTTLFLLIKSGHYESAFIYLLLNVLFTSILAVYRFSEIQLIYYSFSNLDLWLLLANFFIPVLTCLFHNLLSTSTTSDSYRHFVRNTAILFTLYYIAIFLYIQFTPHPNAAWACAKNNLVPFYTLAEYSEQFIYHDCSFQELLSHLSLPIILYVPLGFLTTLCVRHSFRFFRVLVIVLIPVLTEFGQYLIQSDHYNIDHIIYGFLGCILGEILLLLVNGLFLLIKGTEFPETDQSMNSGLHF